MMCKYIQKYIITNDNMDINYRLKPISVIMYFQDCFARHMTQKNLAAFDITDKNLYWVTAGFNIEFVNELPFWSEEIEVTSWISEISKLKIISDFELKHNGKIFAHGDACWFILDTKTRRPAVVDEMLKNIGTLNKYTLGKHAKYTLPETLDKILSVTHVVNYSDIDFNNHVNNKSYLNIVSNAVNENFKNTHVLEKLSVKYNKECFLGDKLICSTYKTSKDNSFIHKIQKDNNTICEVITDWKKSVNETKITDCDLKIRF